jgi:hypothetical protein
MPASIQHDMDLPLRIARHDHRLSPNKCCFELARLCNLAVMRDIDPSRSEYKVQFGVEQHRIGINPGVHPELGRAFNYQAIDFFRAQHRDFSALKGSHP